MNCYGSPKLFPNCLHSHLFKVKALYPISYFVIWIKHAQHMKVRNYIYLPYGYRKKKSWLTSPPILIIFYIWIKSQARFCSLGLRILSIQNHKNPFLDQILWVPNFFESKLMNYQLKNTLAKLMPKLSIKLITKHYTNLP